MGDEDSMSFLDVLLPEENIEKPSSSQNDLKRENDSEEEIKPLEGKEDLLSQKVHVEQESKPRRYSIKRHHRQRRTTVTCPICLVEFPVGAIGKEFELCFK